MTFDLASPADTARLAAAFAGRLEPGDVLALDGTLGAGKTTFVRSLVERLGHDRRDFGSPTFVLAREYRGGRVPLIHCDAYRLGDADEFLAIGADEFWEGPAAVVIEWASRVTDALPSDRLELAFSVTGEMTRSVTASPGGARSGELLAAVAADFAGAPFRGDAGAT